MGELFIIASSRQWNKLLTDSLHASTGKRFELISQPNELTFENLKKLNPRFIFFPHWSWVIPENIFKNFECVIFHMTDLPFGRGGSPLQNLIAQGIYETQLTALKCVEDIDAGPIYLKRPLSLHGTAEEIYMRASKIIESIIFEIIKTNPMPVEQIGELTLFERRKPEQGNLINAESLDQAFDLIRMLDADGYPSAFINVGNLRLEFTRVSRKVDSLMADVKILLNDRNMDKTK